MGSGEGVSESGGPLCPHCRAALGETLRYEQVDARAADGASRPRPTLLTFCGSCGSMISATTAPAGPGFVGVAPSASLRVADPEDAATPEGQFQLRCRELIDAITPLGFMPGSWIGRINEQGAVRAAQTLFASGIVLPVTRWLVEQQRPELTLEHEITQERWAGLFSPDERAQAAQRLATVGGQGPLLA